MVAVPRRALIAPRHPAWGWRTELLFRTLRSATASVALGAPPERIRARLDRVARLGQVRPGVKVRRTTYGGLRAASFEAGGCDASAGVLLHFHGGGYAVGSLTTHHHFLADLASATRRRVVGVEYRKAPEHPFPAPVDDVVAAFRALVKSGVPAARIVVSGDSAGGGLALALVQRLRDAGEAMPAALALFSPWVCLALEGESMARNVRYDYLSKPAMERFARYYLQGTDPRNPEVSPLHADFRDLPPMLLQAGGAELLVSDIERLAERARAAGVEVRLEVWDGMFHAFHGFAGLLPEAREAFRSTGRFVRSRLPAPTVPGLRVAL
ncbi:MAG: alpha/beta hydrolase [Myxococcota bacterium]